jgi:hypothetical protein
VIFQTDCNLVLYGPNYSDGSAKNSVWASNTAGPSVPGYDFEADGFLIYDGFTRVWNSSSRL